MQDSTGFLSNFLHAEAWIIEIAIGLAVLLSVNYGLKAAIAYLRKKWLFQFEDWRKKIDNIIYLPLQFLLGILAFSYSIDVLGHRFGFIASLDYVAPFRNAALVGCLAWIIMRWKTEAEKTAFFKGLYAMGHVDPSVIQVLGKLFSSIVLVITGMIILQILGLDIVPILAFGGIGAAGIAFAGKDVMANCFGGLLLFIQRPFKIGDTIILLEKNIEGNVEAIGWYFTAIRDLEKRPIFLPNAVFSTMLIVNISRMSHRRIYEKVRIRYEYTAQVPALAEEIKKELLANPAIDTRFPVVVVLNSFKEYYVEILVEAFSLETRQDLFLQVKQEALLAVHRVISKQSIKIALPVGLLEDPKS